MLIENEQQKKAIGDAAIALLNSMTITGVPSAHLTFKCNDGTKLMILIAHDEEADYIKDLLADADDIKLSYKVGEDNNGSN